MFVHPVFMTLAMNGVREITDLLGLEMNELQLDTHEPDVATTGLQRAFMRRMIHAANLQAQVALEMKRNHVNPRGVRQAFGAGGIDEVAVSL